MAVRELKSIINNSAHLSIILHPGATSATGLFYHCPKKPGDLFLGPPSNSTSSRRHSNHANNTANICFFCFLRLNQLPGNALMYKYAFWQNCIVCCLVLCIGLNDKRYKKGKNLLFIIKLVWNFFFKECNDSMIWCNWVKRKNIFPYTLIIQNVIAWLEDVVLWRTNNTAENHILLMRLFVSCDCLIVSLLILYLMLLLFWFSIWE